MRIIKNYKHLIICLLMVGQQFATQSQTKELDSLVQLTQSDIPKKEKVDIFNSLAFRYLVFDSITTAKYASQAINIAEEIKYPQGESDAYYAIGWVTMTFGHNVKAIELFKKVLDISTRANYTKGMANANNGLGDANRNIGDYSQALEHHLKALEYREKLGDQLRVASSYNNIGIIYYVQQDYEKALEYYLKALEIRKAMGDLRQVAVSLNNIGIVYVEQKDYMKGLDYYNQCLAINNELGAESDIARNNHNIGVVYNDHLKKPKESLAYYEKALATYVKLGDNASQTYPLLGLGTAYSNLGNYVKAKGYIEQVITLSKKAHLRSNLEAAYYQLAGIEKGLGNYKEAYEAAIINKQLSDSLKNEEQTKKITLLEAEYKFKKEKDAIELRNEKEHLAMTEQLKRERIIQYAALAGFVVLLIFFFILYRYYKLKKDANIQLTDKNEKLKELRENEKRLAEEAMASKERELATMAMASHEKNSLLDDLEKKLSYVEQKMSSNLQPDFKEIKKTISDSYSLDRSWDSFLHKFEDVHPKFFTSLKVAHPNLTNEDLKVCAYLKIGMNNKEIAKVSHLAIGSVKSKINRLKKKMSLGPEDSIRDFMF